MNDQDKEELSKQSDTLRIELKIWEKEFAVANGGRKASRDDIKQNSEIGENSYTGAYMEHHVNNNCSPKV